MRRSGARVYFRYGLVIVIVLVLAALSFGNPAKRQTTTEGLLDQAVSAYDDGDFGLAVGLFGKAEDQDLNREQKRILASALINLGKFTQAASYLEEVLSSAPGDAEAATTLYLLSAVASSTGDYDKAVSLLDHAMELAPRDEFRLALADNYAKSNRHNEAIVELKQLLSNTTNEALKPDIQKKLSDLEQGVVE